MNDTLLTTFSDDTVASLLDAIPHGIAVVDRECRIVAINRMLETLTGVTTAEAVRSAASSGRL